MNQMGLKTGRLVMSSQIRKLIIMEKVQFILLEDGDDIIISLSCGRIAFCRLLGQVGYFVSPRHDSIM